MSGAVRDQPVLCRARRVSPGRISEQAGNLLHVARGEKQRGRFKAGGLTRTTGKMRKRFGAGSDQNPTDTVFM